MDKKCVVTSNRINWIDTAKGLGIILIVFSHALEYGLLRQTLFSFHVPLFFFLSGLTYKGITRGLPQVWKIRFFRLYLPYVIFSVMSIFVFAVAQRMLPQLKDYSMSIGQGIFGMLYGNARTGNMMWNEPLWFIPCLLAVFLLADILEVILEKTRKHMEMNQQKKLIEGSIDEKKYSLMHNCCFRLTFSVVLLLISYLFGRHFRSVILPFHLEASFFVFCFFQIGFVLGENSGWLIQKGKVIKKNRIVSIFVCILLLVALLIISSNNGVFQVKSLAFGNNMLLFLLTSILGIVAVVIISICIDYNKLFNYIGRHTLPILLMHRFPVQIFRMIPPVEKFIHNSDSVTGIITAVIVTSISICLCIGANIVLERVFPISVGRSAYS